MGKKRGKDRRQEEEDIDLTGPSCRHIKKGTDQTLLKKLSGVSDWLSCQVCENEENKENIGAAMQQDSEEEQQAVWMCLKCGHRGCGRNSENQHAIKHYETPRSDPHCLVISLDNWSVWCYICDDEVQYSRTGHLAQLVTSLKKQTSADPIKRPQKRVKEEDSLLEVEEKIEPVKAEENEDKKECKENKDQKKNSKKDGVGKSQKSGTVWRQWWRSLSQTQLLRQTLNKVTEEKMSLDITPVASSDLRVSSGIMQTLKESRKGTDGEQLKTLVKEYEKNGTPKNFVDHVFGGEMTSTVMCQQCKTVSVVTEMFLDLSLPVSDEAYRKKNQKKVVQKSTSESSQDGRNSPALTNGVDDIPTVAGSKYQQKKAKKQAKKQAKQQKRQQKLEGRVTLDSLTSPSHTESEQTDLTAEAKDGENADNEMHEEAPPSEENPAQISVSEEGHKNLDTAEDEKEKEEDEDSVNDCDSSTTSSVSNRFNVLSEERQSKDSIIDDDKTSDVDQDGEDDTQLVSEMEKVTLDDAFVEDPDAVGQATTSEDELEAKEYTVVSQDPELAFHTLATRTAPEKQECSVQSCLFQFTEVETLTQNNSLLCVTCTKRQPNKDKAAGSKKNVYTDALKQMLISSLPPVLTLHLKRFQQNGYSICKVNRHVQFPLILDLAPFCGVKCKNVTEGDAQILYSLYGIVEHSGTMRSGHYTAYVKVRPECPKPSSNGHAAEGDAGQPRGSWFHISDTSVQPVSESKVQSCQAYLLFYERIL
ncbi:Ubiquitin carboxyl-terminal hydrolase 16 [Larimichthys crocea]|uniref:Uncharacterized protein n=1 Tax=Larimichthys crocea TaxID=215358 RepID=A0ACD3QMP4_LARCR|nr:Ubiquitin carboxyl-terminal hydrolase 16 [Larimichthys crocea]